MCKNKCFVVVLIAIFVVSACAGLPTSDVTSRLASSPLIPDSPDLTKGQLNNGLTYLIKSNKRPQNYAELRLVVKAGSIHEDDSQLGFAHFVEHMAFNGTKDFEKREIIEFVESIGMQFGAHLNAYTSFDETVYQLRIPLDKPKALETGIHILENWAHKISFDAMAIDQERGVVLEEWRGRKGAQERIADISTPILLAGTDYPKRMPIGSVDIIERGSHADLKRFYETWYRPDLMSVIAVGDFDSDKVKGLIEKYFNKLEPRNDFITKKVQKLSVLESPTFILIADKDLTASSYFMTWRTPGFVQQRIDDIRQATIHSLLLRALNTRFNEAIWKPQSEHVNAGVGFNRNYTLGHQFVVGVSTKPGRIAQSFSDVMLQLKRAKDHGITQIELDRQKQIILDGYQESISKQDTFNHGVYVGQYLGHLLTGDAMPSLAFEAQQVTASMATITTNDLKEVLESWLQNDDMVMVTTLPEQELSKAPSRDDLLAIYKDSKNISTEAYEPVSSVLSLMDNLPTPGSVINKEYIDKWDSHLWELSNGAKVLLKVTDFKANEIRFSAYSQGGFSKFDDETYLNSFGMIGTIDNMGLGSLDTEAYNQYMRDKRFSISTRISTYSESASGFTSREELEAFMQNMHNKFAAPRKDEKIFEWLRGLYKPQIEKRLNNPTNLFYAKIRERLNSQDPRSVEFDLTALAQQDLDTIYTVRRQAFANAADFHYVFVGDIDLPEMETMLSQYLATLPANDIIEVAKPLPDYDSKGQHYIRLEKGTEPQASVIMSSWGSATWTAQNSMVFEALKAALRDRLLIRLREELGGVYSVNVSGSFNEWPHQENSLTISFTCDPERIEELKAEVNKVFSTFKNGDIAASSLQNFKTRLLTNRQKRLQDNNFWEGYLMSSVLPFHQTPLHEYEALVNSVELNMVVEAAKIYLSREDGYIAELVPEALKEVQNE